MDVRISKDMLYKTRTLAGRLTSSFRFLKNNLLLFIRLGFYILFPLIIVQSLFNILFYVVYPQFIASLGYYVASFLVVIVTVIVNCLYGGLIYSLIQQYAENNFIPPYKNLQPLKTILLKNSLKTLIVGCTVGIISSLLLAITLLLRSLTFYTLILTIPLTIFLMIPLNYIPYFYIIGEQSLINSIKLSFQKGIKYWGSTFAILFVMGILSVVIMLVGSFPFILGYNISQQAYQAVIAGESGYLPFYFPYIMFILSCVYLLTMYFSHLLIITPMAFQYGNIEAVGREKKQNE